MSPSPSRPAALVTGATRGMGEAIARRLAGLGWDLSLAARDEQRLASLAAELAETGAAVATIPCDLADDGAAAAAVDAHRERHGALDALVLAAGVGSAAPLEDYPMRRLDKQWALNARAPFEMVARALPLLRRGPGETPGRVIALASVEGLHPEPGLAAYSASKAALLSLVRSVNAEENAAGVVATAISPGFVDTDMSAWVHDRIPPEQMIPVADIVRTVEFLLALSPQSVVPEISVHRSSGTPYIA